MSTSSAWEIVEEDYGEELWFGGDGCGLLYVNGWANGGCKNSDPAEWATLKREALLMAQAPALLVIAKSVAGIGLHVVPAGEHACLCSQCERVQEARRVVFAATGEQSW